MARRATQYSNPLGLSADTVAVVFYLDRDGNYGQPLEVATHPEEAAKYLAEHEAEVVEWAEASGVNDYGDYSAIYCAVCGERLSRNRYPEA